MEQNDALDIMLDIAKVWNEWGEMKLDPIESMDTISECILSIDKAMTEGNVPEDWK